MDKRSFLFIGRSRVSLQAVNGCWERGLDCLSCQKALKLGNGIAIDGFDHECCMGYEPSGQSCSFPSGVVDCNHGHGRTLISVLSLVALAYPGLSVRTRIEPDV